jgi:hypothetical protein
MDEIHPPTLNYKKNRTGWLAPSGEYYPCDGAASHYGAACALLKRFHPGVYRRVINSFHAREDDKLQEHGWIRVGAMMSYNYGFVIWKEPTQKQLDAIFDYCKATKCPMPSLEVV